MTAIKYKTREEALAAVRLSIAKKREWLARVDREWAEADCNKNAIWGRRKSGKSVKSVFE